MKLQQEHCREALKIGLVIGSDSEAEKKFTFHAWNSEYQVHHKGKIIASGGGDELKEILAIYNELTYERDTFKECIKCGRKFLKEWGTQGNCSSCNADISFQLHDNPPNQ